MNTIILIPARMASTRLPGKPLRQFGGIPMIVHVAASAARSGVGEVVVACDGAAIADVIARAGGTAVLTDPDLPSGSDRIYAALREYDPKGRYDVIINVQGDMLKFDPANIAIARDVLNNPEIDIATLAAPITEKHKINDPAVVKAVIAFETAKQGRGVDFSRQAITAGDGRHYEHIGLYAYRRAALERFIELPQSPREKNEKLEQLRALENGMRIDVAVVGEPPCSIDTEEQAMAAATQFT